MIRRIAVPTSGEKAWSKALETAAKAQGVNVVELADPMNPPLGTSAILCSSKTAAPALAAAVALGETSHGVLSLLARAIDVREGFADGSSERVRQHAIRFGHALRLDHDQLLALDCGALLRDVGKLSVPNSVLLKSGVLSYDEWLMLQRHPHLGAELLGSMPGLSSVIPIVKNHHECFDGDGYPDKLEGNAIPLLARMMKIVDVYCAMTSARHYRKTHCTHETAVAYLRSERGKHFDPALVDVFIESSIGWEW
jgi:response regulator RpfG family c-di-GMP phosphodiesterase